METAEQLGSEVHDKLNGLKFVLRARLAGEGLGWVLIALVATVFATFAFDYVLHLDRLQRGLIMAAALTGVTWVTCRHLVAPMCVPMAAEDLALLVESRHGRLGDRLISAIQFTRPGWAGNALESRAMVRCIIAETVDLVRPLDFASVIERGRLWRVLGISASAAAMLVAFALWQGDLMRLWLKRNLAFADVDWPQHTYLRVGGGPDFTCVRGDDLNVVICADEDGVIPPYVILHARYPSVGWTEERINLSETGDTRYEKRFLSLVEEFVFYVTGGDDRRDKRRFHHVRLIDPPSLRSVRFCLEYPGYMNLPPRSIKGSRGVLAVPSGSLVEVFGEATKDLSAASIMLDGRDVGTTRIEADPSQTGAPRRVVGRFSVAGGPAPQTVKPKPMELRFALQDTEGYTNRKGQKYLIEVRSDRTPSVDITKHSVRPIITPNAIIPLRVRAEDDFGIATARAVLSAQDAKLTEASTAIEPPPRGGRKLHTQCEVDIKRHGLAPGQTVSIHVEVEDTLPEDFGGPNTVRSGKIELRIVKPEELMAQLILRQKELRIEFVQTISLQESVREKTAVAAGTLAAGAITPEIRRQLGESARAQAAVGSECAKTAENFQAVLAEMTFNRLGSPNENKQMTDGIIEPLKGLAQPISRLTAMLNATSLITEVEPLREQAANIGDMEQDILKRMTAILQQMRKLENRQDMINALLTIIEWSEQQLNAIERKRSAQAGNVFEAVDGGKKDGEE